MRLLNYCVVSLVVVSACSANPAPHAQAPSASTPSASEPPTPPEKVGEVATHSNIAIADEIIQACEITDADAHFVFDSANLRPQDQAILQKLAGCFMSGPLKGRHMLLVGHADPRGDEEYNMVLGGRRADNVKSAIAQAGMSAVMISTTSRGKLDAKRACRSAARPRLQSKNAASTHRDPKPAHM